MQPTQHPSRAPEGFMTVAGAIGRGTIGFTIVSIAGFAVWAFAGRWFYRNVGEAGLYAFSTIVFLGLSGLLLHPLMMGPKRPVRFYKFFIPAFIAYAIAWCACWFAWRFGQGEWLGSAFGAAAFAFVLAIGFRNFRAFGAVALVLFLFHSIGYFSGDAAYKWLGSNGPTMFGWSKGATGLAAKLLWGFCYGAGFGAGIGYAFAIFQRKRSESSPV
jgi:hypothetical protein